MFKLFVFAAIVAVAAAKPGYLASPLISTLVGQKTIESHGNAVVHASAPVLRTVAAAPIIETFAPQPIIKTIAAQPIIKSLPVAYSAPSQVIYNAAPSAILSEQTISNHGHSIVHGSQPIISTAYASPIW